MGLLDPIDGALSGHAAGSPGGLANAVHDLLANRRRAA
jgi:hypothetical protein